MLEFGVEAIVSFLVVHPVVEMDVPLIVEKNPILRVGKIFRTDPPADRVRGHRGEKGARGKGSALLEHGPLHFAEKLDVAEGKFRIGGLKIVIVDSEGLLKHNVVKARGKGKDSGIDMAHVMAAHKTGAIADLRGEEKSCRMDRPARKDDGMRRNLDHLSLILDFDVGRFFPRSIGQNAEGFGLRPQVDVWMF